MVIELLNIKFGYDEILRIVTNNSDQSEPRDLLRRCNLKGWQKQMSADKMQVNVLI